MTLARFVYWVILLASIVTWVIPHHWMEIWLGVVALLFIIQGAVEGWRKNPHRND